MAADPSKRPRKRIKNQVQEDLLWVHQNETAEQTFKAWNNKWNWLANEYRDLQKKGAEVTKKSVMLRSVNAVEKEPDLRDIKPVPLTTNGQYGWISTRPDFALDIYQPHVYSPPPLPEYYVLDTRQEYNKK